MKLHSLQLPHFINYIVERGRIGDHVLFDASLIRSTFSPIALEELDRGENGFERVHKTLHVLSIHDTIEEPRDFISRLPRSLQELLCYHYFQLLERHESSGNQTVH